MKLQGGQLPAANLRGRKQEREPVMMKDRGSGSEEHSEPDNLRVLMFDLP